MTRKRSPQDWFVIHRRYSIDPVVVSVRQGHVPLCDGTPCKILAGPFEKKADAEFERKQIEYDTDYPNPCKKNPGGRKLTKLQKKVKAAKASAKRRVAVALAKYLKQANPGRKIVGARVYKGKGGSRRIVPVFAKRGKR
jgi:hypothetical protein